MLCQLKKEENSQGISSKNQLMKVVGRSSKVKESHQQILRNQEISGIKKALVIIYIAHSIEEDDTQKSAQETLIRLYYLHFGKPTNLLLLSDEQELLFPSLSQVTLSGGTLNSTVFLVFLQGTAYCTRFGTQVFIFKSCSCHSVPEVVSLWDSSF